MSTSLELVKNGEALVAAFGGWPSFHDAEVVRAVMDRRGPLLEMAIRVFSRRQAEQDAGELVGLRFTGIRDLQLFDFNEQNVLSGLRFVKDVDGTRVLIDGIYGLTGSLVCDSIEVTGVGRTVLAPA